MPFKGFRYRERPYTSDSSPVPCRKEQNEWPRERERESEIDGLPPVHWRGLSRDKGRGRESVPVPMTF